MKVKDLEVGEQYTVWYRTKSAYGIPAIKTLAKIRLLEILPRGRARVEEEETTWDYENRPEGWSKTDWMLHSALKKPVVRKKERVVQTRALVAPVSGSPA